MTIGLVAIGLNEGERLRICLESGKRQIERLVYVDSGSTDGSIELARSLGVEVVSLDLGIPFTAARARNAGFQRLCELSPGVEFVQFIDGDCELVPGFCDKALEKMRERPRAAVVCGRRRERHPDASVYNQLCDREWNAAVGLTRSCGGDAFIRVAALQEVGGYNPEIIAGEEPELCFRLRERGWEVWRLDAEMTLHDANMTQFSQWWKRNVRAGHAYAEAFSRHGDSPERTARKEVLSNFAWAMPATWPLWPLLFWRVYRRNKDLAYSAFLVLGKIPQTQGQLKYWFDARRGVRRKIIEYK
jgi:GT2 family glycosyltransferase